MRNLILILLSCAWISSAHAQQSWSLQQCIDYAYQHNIQIQQGELNIQLSEANRTQSMAGTLPSVNASASHGYNWGQTIDPFTNQFATERIRSNSFGINAGLTIFNGFQQMNSIKQNSLLLEASKQDQEKLKNDIALNVANAYLNVLFNQELLNIAQSNLESSGQQVDRIRKMVDAGAAPKGTLFDIEAQMATDEASLIQAENNLSLAYLSLTQLLQMSREEAENFSIVTPGMDDLETNEMVSNSDAVVNSALSNFPEIKSAEINVMSAEKGLDIAQGGMSPRLSASFSYGTGYSGANQLVTSADTIGQVPIGQVAGTGETVLTLSPQTIPTAFETKAFSDQLTDNVNQSLFFSLSIPIFNGLSTRTSIQRAKIGVENARLNLESAKNTLTQNVERAYADAQAAYRSYLASERSVEAAEEAMKYATIRYEEGVINAVDYTTARVRQDNAKADMIRNKYQYVFRSKVVDFYLGKPITMR